VGVKRRSRCTAWHGAHGAESFPAELLSLLSNKRLFHRTCRCPSCCGIDVMPLIDNGSSCKLRDSLRQRELHELVGLVRFTEVRRQSFETHQLEDHLISSYVRGRSEISTLYDKHRACSSLFYFITGYSGRLRSVYSYSAFSSTLGANATDAGSRKLAQNMDLCGATARTLCT
jgi:hypothetical protein